MSTRFCLWLVLLYFGGGKLPFLRADSLPLSPQATVSVLTCAPGSETYALFGHSALRITDPLRGFDQVYNYGTFDFATPNFYGRFMRGDLQYFLSVNSFAEFLTAYQLENRVVSEQVLALQPPETQRLYAYLETTRHSSARFYRYQFFADNCTTRLWRDIHASVETPLQVDSTYTLPARSYRQLLAPYLAPAPWVNLGMNLGLGWPADRATTFNQQVFLPVALQQALQHTRRAHRPFAGPAQRLFVAQALPFSQPSWWTPPHCVLGLGFLLLLAQGLPPRYDLLQRSIRFALLASVGLVGCLLFGLMLFSWHTPVQLNYQLLWLLPTHLGLAVARPTRRWRQYARAAVGLLVLSGLFGWTVYYAHLLPVVGWLLLVLLFQLVLFIRPIRNRQLLISTAAK
ncbi:MAG: DUF4105 domain-containing protein [Janthinobacterium lividum]